MLARIVCVRILPGRWADYETAYKSALKARGRVAGLQVQWLARDTADPDAGYAVSIWEAEAALEAYLGSAQHAAMTTPLEPYLASPPSDTRCEVRHLERTAPPRAPGDLDIYHTN